MTDNVIANSGSGGATFATDDISGVHYPISKLAHGALDSATLVSTGSGLPVQQQGTWTVSVSGTIDTELPAAAALGDADGNPTTVQVGACIQTWDGTNWGRIRTGTGDASGSANKMPCTLHLYAGTGSTFDRLRSSSIGDGAAATGVLAAGNFMYNGSTWDRVRGDTTNGVDVDVTRLPSTTNAGATAKTTDYDTGAGTDTVTMMGIALPASGGAVAGGTSTNPVRVDPTGTTTQPVSGTVSITANASVNVNQVGGTAVDTNSGNKSAGTLRVVLATDQPALTNAQPVNPKPTTSGGLSVKRVLSAASTNTDFAKAGGGQLYTVYAHNTNAAVRYLKIYNKASAPTLASDTPVLTLPIPGNAAGAGFVLDTGGMGIAFATGIAFAITTGIADNDTGAVAANEVVVNLAFT